MTISQIILYIDAKIRGNSRNSITGNQMNFILKEIANLANGVSVQTDWNASSGQASILNKPNSFPPSVHSHTINDVTGLSTNLANKADLISGFIPDNQIPAGITRDSELSAAINSHNHTISQVDGLDDVISLKADLIGGFIPDNQIPAGITRDSELNAAIAALVNASPGLLDTLAEIASALGNDPNFATTITNLIAGKVTKSNYIFVPSNQIVVSNPNRPTVDEFSNWNTANGNNRNVFLYYTTTIVSTDLSRYIAWVDNSGVIKFVFIRIPNYLQFSDAQFNLLAGTLPTTTAATRTVITNTGVASILLRGAANTVNGFSFSFDVPQDYVENGSKSLAFNYTHGSGSSLNVELSAQVKISAPNNALNVAGTTITSVLTLGNETTFPLKNGSFNISALTFNPGERVTVRFYRIANNPADTSTSSINIINAKFIYQ